MTFNMDDQIVSKDEPMDPFWEDLIYSDELENGMVVLATTRNRLLETVESDTNLRITNRWCTVTKVRFSFDMVYFIGEYADGSKEIRGGQPTIGWIVKQSSIPVRPKTIEEENSNA